MESNLAASCIEILGQALTRVGTEGPVYTSHGLTALEVTKNWIRRDSVTRIRPTSFLIIILSVTSCVSIKTHPVSWRVETTPAGASVSTTLGPKCESTPCSLYISEPDEFIATIEKPGFETVEVHVVHRVPGKQVAGMIFGYIIIGMAGVGGTAAGGPVPDELTREIYPNPIHINLVPIDPNNARATDVRE